MRWRTCALVVAMMSGCQAHYLDIDGRMAQRLPPSRWTRCRPPSRPRRSFPAIRGRSRKRTAAPVQALSGPEPVQKDELQPAAPGKNMLDRLRFPDSIIGKIPDIQLPATAPPKEIAAAIKKQFPELPRLPKLPVPQPGPNGRPMSLADLQQARSAHEPADSPGPSRCRSGPRRRPASRALSQSLHRLRGRHRRAGRLQRHRQPHGRPARRLRRANHRHHGQAVAGPRGRQPRGRDCRAKAEGGRGRRASPSRARATSRCWRPAKPTASPRP